MITFRDGPARGEHLSLRRTPVLLRVVVDHDGVVDALDQLHHEPVPMLYFRDEALTLPVRDWNLSVLARACGDDARSLRGREVTLSVDTVNGYEFVALSVKESAKTARPAARKRLVKRRSK